MKHGRLVAGFCSLSLKSDFNTNVPYFAVYLLRNMMKFTTLATSSMGTPMLKFK